MTTNPNGGNPAFPIRYDSGQVMDGLTKREYIATQLLTAMASDGSTWESAACSAIEGADTLLKVLSETTPPAAVL